MKPGQAQPPRLPNRGVATRPPKTMPRCEEVDDVVYRRGEAFPYWPAWLAP